MGLITGLMGGTLLWIVMIVAVLYVLRSRGGIRVYGPTLVLRRFDLQEAPRDGVFIRIIGRPSGIVNWLLTILRLSEETALEVTRERLSLRSASLRGQVHDLVPLAAVASTNCGYRKPLWCLFVAGAIFVLGVLAALGSLGDFLKSGRAADLFGGTAGSLIGAAFLGGVFLLIYWLQRKLVLAVRTGGAETHGIVFKPSVIEGVSVDLTRALEAIALLNKKVLLAQAVSEATARAFAGPVLPSEGQTRPKTEVSGPSRCARCGAVLDPNERFCGECGNPVAARTAAGPQ